ncbi:MAG TPA: hypothetical protein VMV18_10285 [bacterium]|nr:hypothetical protein [bacterium]
MFSRRIAALAALLTATAAAAACGSSAHSGATATATPTPTSSLPPVTPTPTPALLSGQLVGGTGAYPGAISGVRFRTPTQSGVTDAAGTFQYRAGETVTFSVADVDFRAATGAPMLSAWQLSANGTCAQSADLVRALVLLASLDIDGDPTNGTAIPTPTPGATQRSLASLSDADVATLVASLIPGRTLVTDSAATNAFITQMDGELWAQIGSDTFSLLDGLKRSQGVTTDGTSWFFSWEKGLQHTDLAYNVITDNILAIPLAQAALGDNHIGDIDYANGSLYVPLEDGSAYVHPYLASYDPTTLTSTAVVAVDNTLMTAGVPWVAADAARSSLYIAQWDPTPSLYVYDMATMAYVRSIPLSTTLARIQGAKVFEGSLYASTDDSAKDIYKINLETGTVIPLFALNLSTEEEGLAFLARPDGSLMHTLNVSGLGMDFRHHQRTRAPLRQSVCTP